MAWLFRNKSRTRAAAENSSQEEQPTAEESSRVDAFEVRNLLYSIATHERELKRDLETFTAGVVTVSQAELDELTLGVSQEALQAIATMLRREESKLRGELKGYWQTCIRTLEHETEDLLRQLEVISRSFSEGVNSKKRKEFNRVAELAVSRAGLLALWRGHTGAGSSGPWSPSKVKSIVSDLEEPLIEAILTPQYREGCFKKIAYRAFVHTFGEGRANALKGLLKEYENQPVLVHATNLPEGYSIRALQVRAGYPVYRIPALALNLPEWKDAKAVLGGIEDLNQDDLEMLVTIYGAGENLSFEEALQSAINLR